VTGFSAFSPFASLAAVPFSIRASGRAPIPPAALTFRNISFSWQPKGWFYCAPAIDRSRPCDKGVSVSDKVAGKKTGKSTGNLQIVVKFLLESARQPAKADKKPTRYYGF